MQKLLPTVALFLITILNISALEVDIEELKEQAEKKIEFINYSGEYKKIDTADEIKAIGWLLAASREQNGLQGSFLGKYSIIRAVNPEEPDKFDADIISIDEDARVDHIDNVRRVIAGYLEASFDYTAEDARLLALFATIYNAVFRGDLEYLSQKYKEVVTGHLSSEDAGISIKYFEWPGATKMVIPLTEKAENGGLSSLSTSELTEKSVIEELRTAEDMGLEDRKEMVEFKEREIEEGQTEIEEAEESIAEQKEAKAEAEKKLQEEASGLSEEEIEQRQAEIDKKKADIEKTEAELAKTDRAVAEKEEEIKKEREQIIEDERSQDLKAQEAASAPEKVDYYSDKLYYLWIQSSGKEGEASRNLTIIDPFSEATLTSSTLAHVSGRSFYFFKNMILLLAGEKSSREEARLVFLHPTTLETLKWGKEDMYGDSMVFIQGGFIYAVMKKGSDYRLARFDEELTLTAQSEQSVDKDSFIATFGDKLYVNSEDGRVLVLDKNDLSQKSVITAE